MEFMEDFARGSGLRAYKIQFAQGLKSNNIHADRRFIEWAQNVVGTEAYFHKKIFFSVGGHF